MHPIMSDIDLSVRHFERTQERTAQQHRLLVSDIARQVGLPGFGTRMVHAVWQFVDPRGFALAQYRQTEQQLPREARAEAPVTTPSAPVHTFPVATNDRPAWRHAA